MIIPGARILVVLFAFAFLAGASLLATVAVHVIA